MLLKLCRAFLCLTVLAGSASAQASDELIPRKLAESLLAGTAYGAMGRPEILVGSLPPTVQSKVVLPSGAKVLGGMVLGEMALGILILDGPLNSAADIFSKELLKGGWEVFDQAPDMFYGAGFIDAPSGQRRAVAGTPEMYCGRGGTLNVRYEPDGFAQTRVIVGSLPVNQCAMRREAMLRGGMGGGGSPAAPILVNPGGARNQMGICPSYNIGMSSRGTDLNSQMMPQDILAHYAKQMADSGWKQVGSGVTAAFTKTDTAGVVTEYQLTVRNSGSSRCRKVDTELRGQRGR